MTRKNFKKVQKTFKKAAGPEWTEFPIRRNTFLFEETAWQFCPKQSFFTVNTEKSKFLGVL